MSGTNQATQLDFENSNNIRLSEARKVVEEIRRLQSVLVMSEQVGITQEVIKSTREKLQTAVYLYNQYSEDIKNQIESNEQEIRDNNKVKFAGKLEKNEGNILHKALNQGTQRIVSNLINSMSSNQLVNLIDWDNLSMLDNEGNIFDTISDEARNKEEKYPYNARDFRKMNGRSNELKIRSLVADKNYDLTLDFLIHKILLSKENTHSLNSDELSEKEDFISNVMFSKLQKIFESKKENPEFKNHQDKLEEFYELKDIKDISLEDLKKYLDKIQKSPLFRKNEKQVANIILWVIKKKLQENKVEELLEDVVNKISEQKTELNSWQKKLLEKLKLFKIKNGTQSMIQLLVLIGVVSQVGIMNKKDTKQKHNTNKQAIELVSSIDSPTDTISDGQTGQDPVGIKKILKQIEEEIYKAIDLIPSSNLYAENIDLNMKTDTLDISLNDEWKDLPKDLNTKTIKDNINKIINISHLDLESILTVLSQSDLENDVLIEKIINKNGYLGFEISKELLNEKKIIDDKYMQTLSRYRDDYNCEVDEEFIKYLTKNKSLNKKV